MTYSDLELYESEVEDLVNIVLDAVRDKSFQDYVLLLGHGGYQSENEGTFLSPYVISCPLEMYQDRTRERFLVSYLNTYASLLKDSIFMANDCKEYDLNIQMMIYAQIWESHQFLKTLKRIGDILTDKPYEWKILFEKPDKNGIMRPIHKGNMIQEQIIKTLKKGHPTFGKFVENLYDSQLRNDFAHASYYIDIENNSIQSLDSERYVIKKTTDLTDWEQTFIYSVMLSYHLIRSLSDRCNSFPDDYPKIPFVTIDWPSYKTTGVVLKAQVFPERRPWGIEFNFKRKSLLSEDNMSCPTDPPSEAFT